MQSVDIALYLDLDNLIIGANEAKLRFDIDLVLDHVAKETGGRVALRQSYGDWRMAPDVLRELARAGFRLNAVVRLGESDKNLADTSIVADALCTLIDGHQFGTYVLVTGDRDFVPLVRALQEHGRRVIGMGVRHTCSSALVEICDAYVFYDDIAAEQRDVSEGRVADWVEEAATSIFAEHDRVTASVFREEMQAVSDGEFGRSPQAKGSFRKLLEGYTDLVALVQENTTLYVGPPVVEEKQPLHLSYLTSLKKRGLRVVPPPTRLQVLRDILIYLERNESAAWQQIVDDLYAYYEKSGGGVSKSFINDVLRVARRAQVVAVGANGKGPLAALPITLSTSGDGAEQLKSAVMRCDATYVRELQMLKHHPFDWDEASMALYGSPDYVDYLKLVLEEVAA